MAEIESPQKDRTYAAMDKVTGTLSNNPPEALSQHNSDDDKKPPESFKLPLASYLIIIVEGCERYCYYGVRTILLLYLMNFILLSTVDATVGFHLFSFACYFTPTIGAVIADGFIGRYWTILGASVIYLIGTSVLSITAIPNIGGRTIVGPVIGLLLIAFGTGGIKPSVGPFGADQILNPTPKQLNRFFAIYYFSINVGSFAAQLIAPIIRSDVQCFGYDCYSLAFGVPAILMLITLTIYALGTPLYRRIVPKENIIAIFVAVIWRALRNRIRYSSSERRKHCLDYADDKYSKEDIEDVRAVLRVFLLFTPIPVFYSLYSQSGSRWVSQATLMNGNMGSSVVIQPDQMQSLVSLFTLIFIPFFEEVVYPISARCNFLIKPLQRMFCGMLFIMFSFFAAAILQAVIQSKATVVPVRTDTNIFNGYNCPINIDYNNRTIQTYQSVQYSCSVLFEKGILLTSTCDNTNIFYKISSVEACPSILIVSQMNDTTSGKTIGLTSLTNSLSDEHGLNGNALLRVVSLDGLQKIVKTVPNNYVYDIEKKLVPTDYQSVLPATYQIENEDNGEMSPEKLRISTAAVYTVVIYNTNTTEFDSTVFEDVPPCTISILWQIIQNLFMGLAEVLFTVPGLTFAYAQAPKRYKTVIMSAWLLASAIGDLIVIVFTEIRVVQNKALEFLLYALLMSFATFVFGMLAMNYKEYRPNNNDSEDQQLIVDKNPLEVDQRLQ